MLTSNIYLANLFLDARTDLSVRALTLYYDVINDQFLNICRY